MVRKSTLSSIAIQDQLFVTDGLPKDIDARAVDFQ